MTETSKATGRTGASNTTKQGETQDVGVQAQGAEGELSKAKQEQLEIAKRGMNPDPSLYTQGDIGKQQGDVNATAEQREHNEREAGNQHR